MTTRTITQVIPAQAGWFAQFRLDPKHAESRHGRGGYRMGFLPILGFAQVTETYQDETPDAVAVIPLVCPYEGFVKLADEEPGFHFIEYYPDVIHPGITTGHAIAKSNDPNSAYWYRECDWVADL